MKRERHAVMTHNSVEIEIQKIKKNKKKKFPQLTISGTKLN